MSLVPLAGRRERKITLSGCISGRCLSGNGSPPASNANSRRSYETSTPVSTSDGSSTRAWSRMWTGITLLVSDHRRAKVVPGSKGASSGLFGYFSMPDCHIRKSRFLGGGFDSQRLYTRGTPGDRASCAAPAFGGARPVVVFQAGAQQWKTDVWSGGGHRASGRWQNPAASVFCRLMTEADGAQNIERRPETTS